MINKKDAVKIVEAIAQGGMREINTLKCVIKQGIYMFDDTFQRVVVLE